MRILPAIVSLILGLLTFAQVAHAQGASNPGAIVAPANNKNNSNRLLRWIQPEWVDAKIQDLLGRKKPGDGSDDGSDDMNGAGSSKNGSGNGAGAGSGAKNSGLGSLAGSGSGGSQKDDGTDTSDRGGQPPQSGGGGGGGSIAFPKWWPACVFIDPKYGNGNEIIKGAVDMAAACQVNLVVFPITIQSGSYTNNEGDINAKQKASCNIGSALGVPNWSTSTINQFDDPPAQMCGVKKPDGSWDTGVAGCAQLASGSKAISSGSSGGVGSGGATPSIENGGGASAGVLMHEMIGHSQMGMPNFEGRPMIDLGLGIGKQNGVATLERILDSLYALSKLPRPYQEVGRPIVAAGLEGTGLKDGFNGMGCAIFFGNAYKNDGRWRYDPQQKGYYVREENIQRQWPLGKPLFGPPGPPPPNSPPPMINDSRPQDQLTFDDTTPKQPDPMVSTVAPPSEPGGLRHKKRPGESSTDALVSNLKKAISSDLPPDPAQTPNYPPDKPGAEKSDRLVFDNSVKKGGSEIGDNGGNNTSTYSGGSTGQADSAQLVFDDTVKKGEGADTSGNAKREPAANGVIGPAGDGAASGDLGAGGLGSGGLSLGTLLPGGVGKNGLSDNLDSDFFKGKPKKKAGPPPKRVRGATLRPPDDSEVSESDREISPGK